MSSPVTIPKWTVHFAKFMTSHVYGRIMRLEMWARNAAWFGIVCLWFWPVTLAAGAVITTIVVVTWRLYELLPYGVNW